MEKMFQEEKDPRTLQEKLAKGVSDTRDALSDIVEKNAKDNYTGGMIFLMKTGNERGTAQTFYEQFGTIHIDVMARLLKITLTALIESGANPDSTDILGSSKG